MTTHNNTSFTLAEIEAMPVVAKTVNKWRGRVILLRACPDAPEDIISDGTTLDCSTRVICRDSRNDWTRQLEAAADGRVLVTE